MMTLVLTVVMTMMILVLMHCKTPVLKLTPVGVNTGPISNGVNLTPLVLNGVNGVNLTPFWCYFNTFWCFHHPLVLFQHRKVLK